MAHLKWRTASLLAICLVVVTFLSFALITPALAQEQITDDDVNEIAKEVYCPVCESTPLDVCETKACADWRELIRSKLGDGQTKQQIFDYFATQYGDRVLASPPRDGFGLILWLWPIVAVAVGLFFFGRYLRSLRSASAAELSENLATEPEAAVAEPPDDYTARIENELARK